MILALILSIGMLGQVPPADFQYQHSYPEHWNYETCKQLLTGPYAPYFRNHSQEIPCPCYQWVGMTYYSNLLNHGHTINTAEPLWSPDHPSPYRKWWRRY